MFVKLFLAKQSLAANIYACIHATFLHLSTCNMLQQKNLKLSKLHSFLCAAATMAMHSAY